MKIASLVLPALLLPLCACRNDMPPPTNSDEPVESDVIGSGPVDGNAHDPIALPDDRTPLEEPNGPIDPKSAEAAGQVVQRYAALIEQRRFQEAEQHWFDDGMALQFSEALGPNRESHFEIGKPRDLEGAAGSIYVTVPVVLYGRDREGERFRRAANVILRRVNDVPGSTDAERTWHIDRIEWTARH